MRGRKPTDQQWAVLDAFWFELLRNPLRLAGEEIWPPVRRQGVETVFLCTDASETAWSWCEMRNGKVASKMVPIPMASSRMKLMS